MVGLSNLQAEKLSATKMITVGTIRFMLFNSPTRPTTVFYRGSAAQVRISRSYTMLGLFLSLRGRIPGYFGCGTLSGTSSGIFTTSCQPELSARIGP